MNEKENGTIWKTVLLWLIAVPVLTLIKVIARQK